MKHYIAATSFTLPNGTEIAAGEPVPKLSSSQAKYLGHALTEVDPVEVRQSLIDILRTPRGARVEAPKSTRRKKATPDGDKA